MLDRSIELFVGRFVRRPRLWDKTEWGKFTNKEKFWIWYKHHFMLIGQGNAEVDNLLFFTQGQFLQLMGIWMANVAVWNLPAWTIPAPFAWFIVNKYIMWRIGNWKDNKDLIALEQENTNKRDIFVRQVRGQMMKEPFREKL